MITIDFSEHTYADHNAFMRLRAEASVLASEVSSLGELERALQEKRYGVGRQEGRGVKELIVFKESGDSLASIILRELAHPVTT